ncbi:PREDICTED: zinc finger protein ZAT12-like [Nicotiana attenuata]|uniref:Zinc finger protein zat11 n=1 Tax=Nicotiana attenuata TaxID=49451 RepID=A0A314KVW9_NICAT|nr:PREDICTED: zinc finger protein ZAT12-like [Nicotiana attenuata]OIT33450.1 zinc finger protein zat11 [Nicotiana attenuata]
MTGMKRSREENMQVEAEAMANCALMLLSRLNNNNTTSTDRDYHNEFECKTCNKRFPSFQGLGGHRASHKRPKLLAGAGDFLVQSKKNKMHECSICGMDQALGGHMRRYRGEINKTSTAAEKTMIPVAGKKMIPVLKKSNSSKRIFCLDLNLTPDVDVDLKLWPTAPVSSPVLRCFF